MKLFVSLLVAMGLFTLGCVNPFADKEEEKGEGSVEKEVQSLEEQFETLKSHVSSTYNKTVGYMGTVTVGEESETIGVMFQSNLEGTETIALVVEGSSAVGVEEWIMEVGSDMVSLQKKSCSDSATLESQKKLSGAIAVIAGENVVNLTGGIECSIDPTGECNSLVKGFQVKGLGKDEAGNVNSVILSKEGAEDIVASLTLPGEEVSLSLALYVAFLSSINSSELCSNIQKAEEAKAAAEAAAAATAEADTVEAESPAPEGEQEQPAAPLEDDNNDPTDISSEAAKG